MKTSLYQILGIESDASQEDITVAYQQIIVRLHRALDLGDADAINQTCMLKDGYRILSNPERRAQYDQMLKTESAPIQTTILIDEGIWYRQMNLFTALAVLLAATVSAIAYLPISAKMDEARSEYQRAVAREHKNSLKKSDVVEYKENELPLGVPLSAER